MVYFVRVSVCGCGWSWSFQGDFNIYYCFPLLLEASSEALPSLLFLYLSFLSAISSHQPLSSPCYTPFSEADWFFSTPSSASGTFPLYIYCIPSVLSSLTLLTLNILFCLHHCMFLSKDSSLFIVLIQESVPETLSLAHTHSYIDNSQCYRVRRVQIKYPGL